MHSAGTLLLTRRDPFWISALQSSKISKFVLNLCHFVIAAIGIQYTFKRFSLCFKATLKDGVAFYSGIGLKIQDVTRKVRVQINLEHAFHGLLCREQVVPGPTEVVQINNPQGALTPGHPHHQTHGLLTRRAS